MESSILTCINNYNELLDIEYVFLIGRKNNSHELTIHFDKHDFYHLAGLQYLTDIGQLHGNREKIYDGIRSGRISSKTIESSAQYSLIKERVDALTELSSLLESDKLIFRFNSSLSVFTRIRHEYLIEFTKYDVPIYLFLKAYNDKSYHGISFFPESRVDYTKGETRWALLKVTKNVLSSDGSCSEVIYASPSLRQVK